jgi:hypothetical protein
MKGVIKLFCPHSECKGENPITTSLEFSDKDLDKTITCPSCNKEIILKQTKAICPFCNTKNTVYIPHDNQVLESHKIDSNCFEKCSKKEIKQKMSENNLFWYKCEKYLKSDLALAPNELEWICNKCNNSHFHIHFVPGETTACFMDSDLCENIQYSNTNILMKSTNLFVKYIFTFPIIFRMSVCNKSINVTVVKKFLEFVFCCILGFSLSLIYPLLIFSFFGYYHVAPIQYYLFLAVAFSFLLYFFYMTMKDIIIITGELEVKMKKLHAKHIKIAFFLNNKKIFLLLISLMFLFSTLDELNSYGLHVPNEEAKIRWIQNIAFIGMDILFALIIPIITGFGILLYWLWDSHKTRHSVSLFKSRFLEVSPSIEKLGETAMHIILFVGSILFSHKIVLLYLDPGLYQLYAHESKLIYDSLVIGLAVIVPLVVYFLYLGKFVSDYKTIELRKIDRTISDYQNSEQLEKWKLYRTEVTNSLKWIRSVEYGSRILLVAFIGLESYLLGLII